MQSCFDSTPNTGQSPSHFSRFTKEQSFRLVAQPVGFYATRLVWFLYLMLIQTGAFSCCFFFHLAWRWHGPVQIIVERGLIECG
jgi:hypothetical protein